MDIGFLLIGMLGAYLIGSIPAGFILVKFIKKVDIRDYGSGNVGATNASRVIGRLPAICVLLFDVVKGSLMASLFAIYMSDYIVAIDLQIIKIAFSFCVISGHIWPIFLKFKGGKGVATSVGVLLALDVRLSVVAIGIWLAVVFITRYVSLASIIACISTPLIFLLFNRALSLIIFCCTLALMVTWKHKANIRRLIEGTESKIFNKSKTL